jgi:hypothetical protein
MKGTLGNVMPSFGEHHGNCGEWFENMIKKLNERHGCEMWMILWHAIVMDTKQRSDMVS